jgi:uncharacterized protein (DUF2141 family)
MKLISQQKEAVITETSIIELDSKLKVIVIDYFNEKGKIIDTIIRDENGFELDDPILYENINEFLENQITE